MKIKQLEELAKQVMAAGPRRVVINEHGEATTLDRARRDHAIEPSVIFIRDDGWSLGAPEHLVEVAESLWKESWVGVMYEWPNNSNVIQY